VGPASSDMVDVIAKVVRQLPDLHCEDAMDDEQYPWTNNILDRLQDYAFTTGFAVVTLTGSEEKGRMRFGCVHHRILGSLTILQHRTQARSASGLIQRVDKITGIQVWILSLSDQKRSHPLTPDLSIYIQHKRWHPEYLGAILLANSHCEAGLSHGSLCKTGSRNE